MKFSTWKQIDQARRLKRTRKNCQSVFNVMNELLFGLSLAGVDGWPWSQLRLKTR